MKSVCRVAVLISLVMGAVPVSAQIANIAVTSAADYSIGVPSMGGIGALFCTGLSMTGVQPAVTVPLPTTLAGVQVTIAGYPAPLYAVASLGDYQQINFQAPQGALLEYVSRETFSVTVSQFSQSATADIQILKQNPRQLFELPAVVSTNPPVGVFQHDTDYSLITSSNPAKSGENITVYGTAFLELTPFPPDGTPASADPLTEVVPVNMPGFGILDNFAILIDGTIEITIQFMGLTPGAVGLGQINFAVPSLATGAHQVQIKQDHRLIDPIGSFDAIYLSKPVILYTE